MIAVDSCYSMALIVFTALYAQTQKGHTSYRIFSEAMRSTKRNGEWGKYKQAHHFQTLTPKTSFIKLTRSFCGRKYLYAGINVSVVYEWRYTTTEQAISLVASNYRNFAPDKVNKMNTLNWRNGTGRGDSEPQNKMELIFSTHTIWAT